ncbi:MAG: hypothetical protein Q9217_001257 [Psora testacea]
MSANSPEEPNDDEHCGKTWSKKKRRKIIEREKLNSLGKHLKANPNGKRVWTWLVLSDDDTVISIHENPFPGHRDPLRETDAKVLELIRRNLCNVFKQLSRTNRAWRKENPINTLDIRPGLSFNHTTTVTISDSPGLLFYYLFDDWYTSYALVARKEQQYADRAKMFEKAQITRIQQLHQTGRQLAVLKRMYQSYAIIIERILSRQKPPSGNYLNAVPGQAQTQAHIYPQSHGYQFGKQEDEGFGAPLTSKAVVKFERLKDRINLYALSEIQECLDEKESLVFLNFNLMTMRQSDAVEKLARITILLAKVTILFLPVSLMTGYFSVQISDLQGVYTSTTYWVCFAVVMGLSLLFLIIFGIISHTLEGEVIYRSITDASLTIPRKAYGIVRKRAKN